MKILIISFFNEWITHLATELELAQVHLDQGHDVSFLGCDGVIGACLLNASGSQSVCDDCRLRRSVGLRMLSSRVREFRLADYIPQNMTQLEYSISSSVTDAESAREFRYNGQDLGWGGLSSTIMKLRDPVCDSAEARVLLQRFTKAALRSYVAVEAFLKANPDFDRVYIFNGRFACTRGAFRACQTHGISSIVTHERGSSTEKYELFADSLPHDRTWWQKRIESAWSSATDDTERNAVGRAYFESRRRGRPADWKSFTTTQEVNSLPNDWDGSRTNVGIFTSSEDEFAGIGDMWQNRIYGSQSEAVERIVVDARARYPNMHFYLRVHPNLSGVTNSEVKRLLAIKSSNLTIIEPASSVSTYALLDAVDRVLTFGSTVGVEATFWGKISLLAGPALYEHLDVAYVVESHDNLMRLLGDSLQAKPIRDSIKYGFCVSTFGIPFVYWCANGFEDGRFRGRRLTWWSTTHLERRLLMGCLRAGVHTPFIHDTLSALSKIGSAVWNAVGGLARKVHG